VTISRKQQEVEERELLSAVLKSVGDDLLETKFIEKPDFPDYHETTWLHLFQRGLLEDMGQKGMQTFTMTPIGWILALHVTNQINDPLFVDRLSHVCAAAKRELANDRSTFAICRLETLALEAHVPEDWLANAIEAKLIEHKFKQVGIRRSEERGSVFIPQDVGHKLIS